MESIIATAANYTSRCSNEPFYS